MNSPARGGGGFLILDFAVLIRPQNWLSGNYLTTMYGSSAVWKPKGRTSSHSTLDAWFSLKTTPRLATRASQIIRTNRIDEITEKRDPRDATMFQVYIWSG